LIAQRTRPQELSEGKMENF